MIRYTPIVLAESSDTIENDPAIAKMAAEGGALWYHYLLSKAIPYDGFPNYESFIYKSSSFKLSLLQCAKHSVRLGKLI